MDIAVCSACDTAYAPLQSLTAPTIQAYCKIQGYEPRVSIYGSLIRPPSWHKLIEIGKCLAEGFEAVLWVDTDAIVVRKQISIQSLMVEGKNLYLSSNWLGLNCGVILLKNAPSTRKLLHMAWSQTQLINHPWWEQAAIRAIIDNGLFDRDELLELPSSIFNSEEYYGGCLVYHMPDTPLTERIKRFGAILRRQSGDSDESRAVAESLSRRQATDR